MGKKRKNDENEPKPKIDDKLMSVKLSNEEDPCFKSSNEIKQFLEKNEIETENIAVDISNQKLKQGNKDISVQEGMLLCKQQTQEDGKPFRAEFIQMGKEEKQKKS